MAPPVNLRGWWPGDFNADDIAGTANGTFDGEIVSGKVSNAFRTGTYGTPLGDHFVTIPQSSDLEPQVITVDAWIKISGSPGNFRYVVDKGFSDCAGAASYALQTNGAGLLRFYINDGINPLFSSPTAPPSIYDNQWHFIAGTYDGRFLSLYVDGALVGSTDLGPVPIVINYNLPNTNNELILGNYPGCPNSIFNGGIDEVEVFARALPVAEILAIFNAGSVGKCKYEIE